LNVLNRTIRIQFALPLLLASQIAQIAWGGDEKTETSQKLPEAPAEIVNLPPSPRSLDELLKRSLRPALEKPAAKPLASAPAPAPKVPSCFKPLEPGYATVISGTLQQDLELGPEQSPILLRGTLVVPENFKLTLRGGTVVHVKSDPQAEHPTQSGSPDPTQCGVIWIFGTLTAQGVTGNPVEILNQEKTDASVLFYGANESAIDGVRLKGVTLAQNGGITRWANCEVIGGGSYALGSGAAVVTHCTFRKFGGIFATYDAAPWSLLLRRNLFDNCREGLILGTDPGETRLVVEKNHFVNTQGAHIRAMPRGKNAVRKVNSGAASKAADMEFLIGENWYGSAIPEEVDMRIVDCRSDPNIHSRLNTRPPAAQPYANTGAGVSATILQATAKEQQSAEQKLLQAQTAALPKKSADRVAQQAMSVKRDAQQ
jgi:hypothetical protein